MGLLSDGGASGRGGHGCGASRGVGDDAGLVRKEIAGTRRSNAAGGDQR